MTALGKRVAKLEAASLPGGGVIVMWRHVDETSDQAVARWRNEHPGQASKAADLRVIIIRWSTDDEIGDCVLAP